MMLSFEYFCEIKFKARRRNDSGIYEEYTAEGDRNDYVNKILW